MRLAVLASAIALLLVSTPATAQDAFEQRREAERAAMTGLDPIYLTFAQGRSTYRVGEPIPLDLEFTPVGVVGVADQGCPGAGLRVVVDRSDVTIPERDAPGARRVDYVCGVFGGVYGGVNHAVGVLGADEFYDLPYIPPQVKDSMELTADVRFTTPGRYRIYVRTRFDTPQEYGTPPRMSNILTLDILAPDAAWEAAALATAEAALNSTDARTRSAAVGNLKLLGTEGAVDVAFRASGDALARVAASAHNRRHAVARMLERLDDPARPIDWPFLWTLAALDAASSRDVTPPQRAVDARLRIHSERRLRALAAAGRLDDALSTEMRRASTVPDTFSRVRWELPAAGFRAVAPRVARAIEALSASGQRRLLADQSGWREFIDPAFLPMWRRLAATRSEGGVQDVAWAMWRRLEPTAADRFARREIALSESRLGTDGLPGLVVRGGATLDAALAARLETATSAAEMERAASLVERFATPRLQARVATVLSTAPLAATCPSGPLLLAYLFRVAPDVAERHIDAVRFAPYGSTDSCDRSGVLRAAGRRFWSPAFELAASRRLAPGPAAHAIDAADVLAEHGSGAAKAALLGALDDWHARWASPEAASQPKDGDALDWAGAVIDEIAEALSENQTWSLSDADATHIRSRFLSDRSGERWTSNRSMFEDVTPEIRVSPPRHPGGSPTFQLSLQFPTGLDQLVSALRARTTKTWIWQSNPDPYLGFGIPYPAQPTTMWLPGQEEALFAEVRRRALDIGHRVRRP